MPLRSAQTIGIAVRANERPIEPPLKDGNYPCRSPSGAHGLASSRGLTPLVSVWDRGDLGRCQWSGGTSQM